MNDGSHTPCSAANWQPVRDSKRQTFTRVRRYYALGTHLAVPVQQFVRRALLGGGDSRITVHPVKHFTSRFVAILWLMAALSFVGWLIVNLDTAGWILVILTTSLMTFRTHASAGLTCRVSEPGEVPPRA